MKHSCAGPRVVKMGLAAMPDKGVWLDTAVGKTARILRALAPALVRSGPVMAEAKSRVATDNTALPACSVAGGRIVLSPPGGDLLVVLLRDDETFAVTNDLEAGLNKSALDLPQ